MTETAGATPISELPEEGVDECGLLPEEHLVMNALIAAVETYMRLTVEHPDEQDDFVNAIHICQQLLAMRVVRRQFPTGWHKERLDA